MYLLVSIRRFGQSNNKMYVHSSSKTLKGNVFAFFNYTLLHSKQTWFAYVCASILPNTDLVTRLTRSVYCMYATFQLGRFGSLAHRQTGTTYNSEYSCYRTPSVYLLKFKHYYRDFTS